VRQLTDWELKGGDPDWSPDGNWLVFSTNPLRDFTSAAESVLYRIRPDGTSLTRIKIVKAPARLTQPRYLPDGAAIIATAVSGPSARRLVLVPADGTRTPAGSPRSF
jgi:Tol biopolymer transport system component